MLTNTTKRSRTSEETPLQAVEDYILSLDLHTLLTRFQRERYTESGHLSHGIVTEYRRFLTLKIVHHDQHARILSPSPLVDAIWHMHILDTAAYLEMCANLPFFVHHDPDGGLNAAFRQYRYETTLALYQERWGEPGALIWPKTLVIPPTPRDPVIKLESPPTLEHLAKTFESAPSPKIPTKLEGPPSSENLPKHINILGMTGKLTRVNLDPEDPKILVEDVRNAFAKTAGLNVNSIRLIYYGENLETYQSLKDHDIESGDILNAVTLQLVGC